MRMAATAALVASMMANSHQVFGHGGDDPSHDALLETIPAGNAQLLPDLHKNPSLDGQIGPVLPMHTMSVHNTLTWKKDSKMPLMLMFHRHSAYTAEEVANPDVIDFLIKYKHPTAGVNAFGSPSNQFNSSMRRTFQQFAYGGYNIIHDVSQSVPTRMGGDQQRELTQLWDLNHPDAFKYDFQSPPFAAAAITNIDGQLNGSAFYNTGYSKGLYYDMYCPGFSTLEDGRPVFMGGHDLNSQNGNYRTQIFDPETEEWAPRPESCMRKFFGRGNDNKAYRIANLGLDPEGKNYGDDFFLEKFYRDAMNKHIAENTTGTPYTDVEMRTYMQTVYLPLLGEGDGSGFCDPHNLPPDQYSSTYEGIRLAGPEGTVTSPGKVGSDMKYARWYPGQITLPGNKIFVYAGWDRDESKYPTLATNPDGSIRVPDPSTTALQPFLNVRENYGDAIKPEFELAGFMKAGGDTEFQDTRVKQVVPEVYDGNTDTMVALENAPLFHNAWYPNGLVVQTGPGRNDWKVAVNDAEYIGNVVSTPSTTRRDANGVLAKKGAHKPANSVVNRDLHNTYIIDIQAALKDMKVKGPLFTPPASILDTAVDQASNPFWEYLSDSPSSHSEFTGNANIVELDKLGRVVSHKLTHVGGQYPTSSGTITAATAAGATTITVTPGALGIKGAGPYNIESTTIPNPNPGPGQPTTVANPRYETVTVLSISGNVATLAQGTKFEHAAGVTFTVNGTSKNVEEIDFANLSKRPKKGQPALPKPKWEVKGELYQPGRQNYCTPLPDGTIMILGGNGGTLPGIERWSLHTQLYTPGKPYDPAAPAQTNSVRRMAKTLIPRDEHGIIQLMPDATVYLGGQNRNGLVQQGDSIAPLGDADLGVPNGQLFRPPYLFDTLTNPAQRPVITKAPAVLTYGKPFKVSFSSAKKIKSVSIIRAGAMSHSLNTDVRMVKLAFKQSGSSVTVFSPKLPGTAIGGYYQLFILDEAGVPSESVKVALGTAITKRVGKPKSPFALTSATPPQP